MSGHHRSPAPSQSSGLGRTVVSEAIKASSPAARDPQAQVERENDSHAKRMSDSVCVTSRTTLAEDLKPT